MRKTEHSDVIVINKESDFLKVVWNIIVTSLMNNCNFYLSWTFHGKSRMLREKNLTFLFVVVFPRSLEIRKSKMADKIAIFMIFHVCFVIRWLWLWYFSYLSILHFFVTGIPVQHSLKYYLSLIFFMSHTCLTPLFVFSYSQLQNLFPTLTPVHARLLYKRRRRSS